MSRRAFVAIIGCAVLVEACSRTPIEDYEQAEAGIDAGEDAETDNAIYCDPVRGVVGPDSGLPPCEAGALCGFIHTGIRACCSGAPSLGCGCGSPPVSPCPTH